MSDTGLYDALYPLYITHFLMGYIPKMQLSSNEKNNKSGKIREVYNLTSLVTITSMIVTCIVYKLQQFATYLYLNESGVLKFINAMYFIIIPGFTLVIFTWSRFQKKRSQTLWKNLIQLDNDIRSLGIQLDYNSISRSSLRFLLSALAWIHIYLVYLLVGQKWKDPFQATASYGLLYFGVLSYTAVRCTFLTLLNLVSHMLGNLIKKIESVLEQAQVTSSILTRLMCVYHDLSSLCRLVNRIFSMQLLLSFAISFVLLTFQTYNMACSVFNQSPYLNYAIAGSIFISIGIFEKLLIIFECHTCMNRTRFLKLILSKYMAEYSTNATITKELNAFGLQLLHEKFEIYAGNMFLIDLPIFTSVCGTATTYIILLWQTDAGVDLNYSMKRVFGVF